MRNRSFSARNVRAEGGYALLLVVFMTALLVIATLSTGLYVKTEAKREKEEEMIWRGKQYVRGIKLYVRKNSGRFPTSLDDLTKPGVGNIYYMRQAYKDPMNKEDGAWRLLYVGPSGQLIGSLKPQPTNLQLSAFGGQGTPSNLQAGTPTGGTPGVGIPGANSTTPGSTPGTSGTSTGAASGSNGTNPPGTNSSGTDSSGTGDTGSSSNPQPITPTDTPTIIGGKVIGIGSKIDQKSVKVYEQAKNYRLFEFYWDPAKEAQSALQGAAVQSGPGNGSPGTGQNSFGQPGSNPFGQPTSNPTNGQGTGGQPTQQGPGGSPP